MFTSERGETHEKANKEPDSCPSHPKHSLCEALASNDAVDHDHGDGGEHPAQVEHVQGVMIEASRANHQPEKNSPPARTEDTLFLFSDQSMLVIKSSLI